MAGRYLNALAGAALLALGGCDSADPGAPLRFGQSGEIQITIETPLHLGQGSLWQELTWKSVGAWTIQEEISYRGIPGESDLRANPGLPLLYAASYATVIQQLNDNPGLKLIDVDELQDAQCGADRSRVTVHILDSRREERRTWVRCAPGTLGSLLASGSGPDADAARVIEVVVRVRDNTVGTDFRSVYLGSLPFATIDRGTETGWTSDESVVLVAPGDGDTREVEEAWEDFWQTHTGNNTRPPSVDFATEMVLVGMVGVREEVGDSAEIRTVLTVANGTKVDLVERIPGDFCAPARRIVRPFHIAVAPKAPAPIFFGELKREWVPCGTS